MINVPKINSQKKVKSGKIRVPTSNECVKAFEEKKEKWLAEEEKKRKEIAKETKKAKRNRT